MRLVLVGAPASGKGTQANVLSEKFGVPKISTGDMLREVRKAGTKLGREAEGYMNAGKLVPDEVVIGLVDERLEQPDAAKGFILDADGGPGRGPGRAPGAARGDARRGGSARCGPGAPHGARHPAPDRQTDWTDLSPEI